MGIEVVILLVLSIGVLGLIIYNQGLVINKTKDIVLKLVKVLEKEEEVINSHADLLINLLSELYNEGCLSEENIKNISDELWGE